MILNSYRHYLLIEWKRQPINYLQENIISAIWILMVCLCIFFFVNPILGMGAFLMSPSLRWIVHDVALNTFRGLPWDYLGTRARTDKILRKFRGDTGLHFIWIKILFAAINFGVIVLIIKIWERSRPGELVKILTTGNIS